MCDGVLSRVGVPRTRHISFAMLAYSDLLQDLVCVVTSLSWQPTTNASPKQCLGIEFRLKLCYCFEFFEDWSAIASKEWTTWEGNGVKMCGIKIFGSSCEVRISIKLSSVAANSRSKAVAHPKVDQYHVCLNPIHETSVSHSRSGSCRYCHSCCYSSRQYTNIASRGGRSLPPNIRQ